jgi:hypothetical protein
MKTTYIFLLLVLGYANNLVGQSKLEVNIGAAFNSELDLSLSPLIYRGLGLRFGLAYEKITAKGVLHRFSASYRPGTITQSVNFAPMALNHGNLSYLQLRPLAGSIRLGGALSGFVRSKTLNRGNNSVSYDLGMSLGPAADITLPEILGSKWSLNARIELPVVSYYIRPAYGFPLPPAFLEEDRYNAYLDNIAGALPASGEVVTWGDYFELRTVVQLIYRPKWGRPFDEIGVGYNWNYVNLEDTESSSSAEQMLQVMLRYTLSNPETRNQ